MVSFLSFTQKKLLTLIFINCAQSIANPTHHGHRVFLFFTLRKARNTIIISATVTIETAVARDIRKYEKFLTKKESTTGYIYLPKRQNLFFFLKQKKSTLE